MDGNKTFWTGLFLVGVVIGLLVATSMMRPVPMDRESILERERLVKEMEDNARRAITRSSRESVK